MALSDDGCVTGAVLVGGKSRRMGSAKALIRVPEDGPTILERVTRAMSDCVDEVILVGTKASIGQLEATNARMVLDDGAGPVGGLIAALQASQYPRVLLTACDLPFLSIDVLRLVIARSIETGRGVCPVSNDINRVELLQPLPAVYLEDQAEVIERLFASGERSLLGVVHALKMGRLSHNEVATVDPGLWSFFNVNTPADLEIARRHADERT